MNELEKLRDDIDKIDMELVALFEKRMEKVLKIGEYKKKSDLPIFNQAREIEVLKRNTSRLKNRGLEKEVKDFLNRVMEISRQMQRKHMIKHDPMTEDLPPKSHRLNGLKRKLIVGYQGNPGAFSEEALMQYFGDKVNTYNVKEFEGVFKALEADEIDYGVLPIENSSTGGIAEVYDLLRKYGFYIVGEKIIKVEHNLVALKNTSLEDISMVYSHPQAFKQCSKFFKNYPEIELVPYKNTATSAKYINDEQDRSKAAVCSKNAASIYDLEIIKGNINYNDKNYTRFIIIDKELNVNEASNKISILTGSAHTPGSLYKILDCFTQNNLNLMKIESRPVIDRPWEYFFYIDFSGNLMDASVKKSIEAIRENSTYFKLLGNYIEDSIV